ncbi:MAG: beta-ketoacyl-[acyl-carrier-protein] synthase family protein [Candidatus Riflebacteria bacterium]|nr:beta-ketoacyl-[acyl-carrier-protein] synthase family protein [Candidatus Riflebacteria bacterium]
MSTERRAVITGIGLVTPLGLGTEQNWSGLLEGRSGVGPIRAFDAGRFATRIAGEVPEYDATSYLRPGERLPESVQKHTRFAVTAARMAWDDSGLSPAPPNPERFGVYLGAGKGTGLGDLHYLAPVVEQSLTSEGQLDPKSFWANASSQVPRDVDREAEPSRAAVLLASMYGARGPLYTCLTSCAAGSQAIGDAFRSIQYGTADVALCGGSHSMITPLGLLGFSLLNALSTRNDEPARASRPFDKERDGFILAEGAGLLVLEELEHARRRDARIYAELVGYGPSSDAFRATDPHPEAIGGILAIRRALEDAGVRPEDVDYINAHGTSTQGNDKIETMAIRAVFGDHAPRVPVSSTKSCTGHLIAAAGAVELAICCLAIVHGIVPPTINYETPDSDCDLDYVPNVPRKARVDTVLSNSFGFGGQNVALVVRRFR